MCEYFRINVWEKIDISGNFIYTQTETHTHRLSLYDFTYTIRILHIDNKKTKIFARSEQLIEWILGIAYV